MKTKLALFASTLGVVLGGCVPSLNPLYTPQTVVFDSALVGTWIPNKDSDEESWTFHGLENQKYQLTVRNKEKSSTFVAHLVKLGEHRFLDIFPDSEGLEDLNREDIYKTSLIPSHLFLKVHQIEPELRLSFLNSEWLDKLLADHPEAIAHVKIEDDRIVLTAPTEAIQKFVAKYAADHDAFDPNEEGMKRKTDAQQPKAGK